MFIHTCIPTHEVCGPGTKVRDLPNKLVFNILSYIYPYTWSVVLKKDVKSPKTWNRVLIILKQNVKQGVNSPKTGR